MNKPVVSVEIFLVILGFCICADAIIAYGRSHKHTDSNICLLFYISTAYEKKKKGKYKILSFAHRMAGNLFHLQESFKSNFFNIYDLVIRIIG